MTKLALLKKITLGVLLTGLLIYTVSLIYYRNDQKSPLPQAGTILDEIRRYVLNAGPSQTLKRNLYRLSPVQRQTVIKKMGVNNLTSKFAQKQFLNCAARYLLRNSSVLIPQSHQACKTMSFQRSGPIVALGSVPGSGNSWVRQLLESATGVYTGAVYCDNSYIEEGMFGEGVTENVIAIKTHYSPNETKKLINHDIDKAIYIVRNLFECILSENNRELAKRLPNKIERHVIEVDYNYGKQTIYV